MQLPTMGSFFLTLCCTSSLSPSSPTVYLFHEVITSYLAYSLLTTYTIIGNFAWTIV